jgi:hypothetical protein
VLGWQKAKDHAAQKPADMRRIVRSDEEPEDERDDGPADEEAPLLAGAGTQAMEVGHAEADQPEDKARRPGRHGPNRHLRAGDDIPPVGRGRGGQLGEGDGRKETRPAAPFLEYGSDADEGVGVEGDMDDADMAQPEPEDAPPERLFR